MKVHFISDGANTKSKVPEGGGGEEGEKITRGFRDYCFLTPPFVPIGDFCGDVPATSSFFFYLVTLVPLYHPFHFLHGRRQQGGGDKKREREHLARYWQNMESAAVEHDGSSNLCLFLVYSWLLPDNTFLDSFLPVITWKRV